MGKKFRFILLFCLTWTLTAGAQNTIESIRKEYQAVHETIAMMMPDKDGMWQIPPTYFDLNVVQNLPATGPHKENIRMYYGELDPEEEGDPYPPHYLRFTTAKYNFAAREFYEEYFYDDKGNVIFIYAITPDVSDDGSMIPYELRMWFDGKQLLRFNAKKFDGPMSSLDIKALKKGTFKEEFTGKTIPELYRSEAERCQQRAQRFLIMFKGIDDNTYL